MLKVLDLFSGIGGFAYASERIVGGFETVGFCEIDPFCQKVLKKNFPNVPIYTDIKELEQNAVRFRGYVDVICGGFPCQVFSNAGKKEGHEDKKGRYLWPEMVSIIEQILPRFVIGENVRGFVNMPMGLPRSVNDLESIGYRVASFVIPSAYALGLPHRRERCWIIAQYVADTYDSSDRANRGKTREKESLQKEYRQKGFSWFADRTSNDSEPVANTESKGLQRRQFSSPIKKKQSKYRNIRSKSSNGKSEDLANTESIDRNVNGIVREHGKAKIQEVSGNRNGISDTQGKEQGSGRKSFLKMGYLADGISQRLAYDYTIEPKDLPRVVKGEEKRADKLKALGNSIIPQCASVFFQAIRDIVDEYD